VQKQYLKKKNSQAIEASPFEQQHKRFISYAAAQLDEQINDADTVHCYAQARRDALP
jgi:hypothetical protein